MSVQPFSIRCKTTHGLAVAVAVLCVTAYCWLTPTTTSAQTIAIQPSNVRTIKNDIPQHLPVKVKVKNSGSEKWLEELEVEVTNTSNKPIYFMILTLELPDVTISGIPIIFPLRYGRKELLDFTVATQPDDPAIRPKESHTFKLKEGNIRGLTLFEKKHDLKRSDIKRGRLFFEKINFGDGTGFSTTGGLPYPRRQAKSHRHVKMQERNLGALLSSPLFMSSDQPVSWMTVDFGWNNAAEPTSTLLSECESCQCSFLKEVPSGCSYYSTNCDFLKVVNSASSSSCSWMSEYECASYDTGYVLCHFPLANGEVESQSCTYQYLMPCGGPIWS